MNRDVHPVKKGMCSLLGALIAGVLSVAVYTLAVALTVAIPTATVLLVLRLFGVI